MLGLHFDLYPALLVRISQRLTFSEAEDFDPACPLPIFGIQSI